MLHVDFFSRLPLIWGVMMRGVVELLDCLDDQYHVVFPCVRAP